MRDLTSCHGGAVGHEHVVEDGTIESKDLFRTKTADCESTPARESRSNTFPHRFGLVIERLGMFTGKLLRKKLTFWTLGISLHVLAATVLAWSLAYDWMLLRVGSNPIAGYFMWVNSALCGPVGFAVIFLLWLWGCAYLLWVAFSIIRSIYEACMLMFSLVVKAARFGCWLVGL